MGNSSTPLVHACAVPSKSTGARHAESSLSLGGVPLMSSIHRIFCIPQPRRRLRATSASVSGTTRLSSSRAHSLVAYASKAATSSEISDATTLPSAASSSSSSSSRSRFWEWKEHHLVHYEVAGDLESDAPAILLLPGFGVGSFHFAAQLEDLGKDHRVWAMDFFGQGRSWPARDPAPGGAEVTMATERNGSYASTSSSSSSSSTTSSSGESSTDWGFGPDPEPWARDLVYSADTWCDQVTDFVQQIIREPVLVVGNSLGGFIGVYFAARHPTLVRGVTLLNATPFWAFLPNPKASSSSWFSLALSSLPSVLWAGSFPIPSLAKSIARRWWDSLRSPSSISFLLSLVYANREAVSEELVADIVAPTQHPASAAAFASILFAPKAQRSFEENLAVLHAHPLPLCLIYGREDPWVVPLWGERVKRAVPHAAYFELSPCGHCPHHEAPQVVNHLLRGWVSHVCSPSPSPPLPLHFPSPSPAAGSGCMDEEDKPPQCEVYAVEAVWRSGRLVVSSGWEEDEQEGVSAEEFLVRLKPGSHTIGLAQGLSAAMATVFSTLGRA